MQVNKSFRKMIAKYFSVCSGVCVNHGYVHIVPDMI